MQVDVYNSKAEKVGSIELPDSIFAAEVREALLWEQVKAQRASRRAGTHKAKTRGEVAGGRAKPYRQKGTGRARQGSTRSPQFVGGGTVFGPRPRDYGYRLPRSARKTALQSALSMRAQNGLMVLEDFPLEAPRTKTVAAFLEQVGVSDALIVDGDNENLKLSTRNLPKSKYLSARGLNVYDILDHDALVLTKAAVSQVIERFEGREQAQTEE